MSGGDRIVCLVCKKYLNVTASGQIRIHGPQSQRCPGSFRQTRSGAEHVTLASSELSATSSGIELTDSDESAGESERSGGQEERSFAEAKMMEGFGFYLWFMVMVVTSSVFGLNVGRGLFR